MVPQPSGPMPTACELIKAHWNYHPWATRRILQTVLTLTEEQWNQPFGASFASIGGTLKHLCSADHVWLNRVTLDRQSFLTDVPAPHSVSELSAEWNGILDSWNLWIQEATEEHLNALVHYTPMGGLASSHPKWQAILHVINHGSYHRAQVAHMLRQLEVPIPSTDEAAYWRSIG